LRMYNSLVQKCFTDCVDSFRRKDLDSTEEKVNVVTLPPMPLR
jgi:import inner membrane translocase subunit TIM9